MTTSPEAEWMLWAKRMKEEQSGLRQRIRDLEIEVAALKEDKYPTMHQGTRTLREYWEAVNEARPEKKSIVALIDGLSSKHSKIALNAALDKSGWTWSNFEREVQRMLDDASRRQRNRRSLIDS